MAVTSIVLESLEYPVYKYLTIGVKSLLRVSLNLIIAYYSRSTREKSSSPFLSVLPAAPGRSSLA